MREDFGKRGGGMRVLIVENNEDLGRFWGSFLRRRGVDVTLATTQRGAIEHLRFDEFDAMVVELVLPDGGAIAISDYAAYKYPNMPIIPVTSTSFFSDGSIFEIMPNARGILRTPFRLDDLAAILEHCRSKSGTSTEEEPSNITPMRF
jgi:DNA-binding NtrC family response regulator